MTFMHMDATSAAAAVGTVVGWDWTDTAPFGIVSVDAGGDGFSGEANLTIYGEGEANVGKYIGNEDGFQVFNLNWIDPAGTSQIPNYFLRTIDIFLSADGATFPGLQYIFGGEWVGGRTEWQSLATSSPHLGVAADTTQFYQAQASGSFGEPDFEQALDGTIELGSLSGPSMTFASADVSTGLNQITLTGHPFITGDEVLYLDNGGTAPTGLVDNTVYAVRDVGTNTISLGATIGDIDATPNFINLSTQGSGVAHSLQRLEAVASANLFVAASI